MSTLSQFFGGSGGGGSVGHPFDQGLNQERIWSFAPITSGSGYMPFTGTVSVVVVGGGGAGATQTANAAAATSGGGGGGGVAYKTFNVTKGDPYSWTIGAAGRTTGTNTNRNASLQNPNGGTSTFTHNASGTSLTANGGSGATRGSNTPPSTSSGGAGGNATGGDFNFSGGAGGTATLNGNGDASAGGGSAGMLGTGGRGGNVTSNLNGAQVASGGGSCFGNYVDVTKSSGNVLKAFGPGGTEETTARALNIANNNNNDIIPGRRVVSTTNWGIEVNQLSPTLTNADGAMEKISHHLKTFAGSDLATPNEMIDVSARTGSFLGGALAIVGGIDSVNTSPERTYLSSGIWNTLGLYAFREMGAPFCGGGSGFTLNFIDTYAARGHPASAAFGGHGGVISGASYFQSYTSGKTSLLYDNYASANWGFGGSGGGGVVHASSGEWRHANDTNSLAYGDGSPGFMEIIYNSITY